MDQNLKVRYLDMRSHGYSAEQAMLVARTELTIEAEGFTLHAGDFQENPLPAGWVLCWAYDNDFDHERVFGTPAEPDVEYLYCAVFYNKELLSSCGGIGFKRGTFKVKEPFARYEAANLVSEALFTLKSRQGTAATLQCDPTPARERPHARERVVVAFQPVLKHRSPVGGSARFNPAPVL